MRRHQVPGFSPRVISILMFAIAAVANSHPLASGAELLVNGGFEAPQATTGWLVTPAGRYIDAPPAGWQRFNPAVYTFEPSLIPFPGGIPEGMQVASVGEAFAPDSLLFQDVPAYLSVGDMYTLSIEVGSRADYPGAGSVSLRTTSGDILASSGAVAPAPGTFEHVELTYKVLPGDPLLGAQLRVQLERASGLQANFDAASLTVTPVPEPGTLGLTAVGALALLAGQRIRRRAMSGGGTR